MRPKSTIPGELAAVGCAREHARQGAGLRWRRLAALTGCLLVASAIGCAEERSGGTPAASAATASASAAVATGRSSPAVPSPEPAIETPATATASTAIRDAGPQAAPPACGPSMVLVQGDYCPAVIHRCLEHHAEYVREQKRIARLEAAGKPVGRSSVAERCLRFAEPSRCASPRRRPLRFCMDRYEWPNQRGAIPRVLTSWTQAKDLCRSVGKRLCTEHEFNFACEGEQLWPYTYGYQRDESKCSIDRPYIRASNRLAHYESCLADPDCKAELERVDQRVAAGSMPGCVSPFGVYDINGNVDEWVRRVGRNAPSRSGLKGGWWGPLRNRCRPVTTFHKENDYGYGIGFRCCRDARVGAVGE